MALFNIKTPHKDVDQEISKISYPLNDPNDLGPLYEKIGKSRLVLLGEASHGTHEYYTWRSQISKKLITEKDFNFIAVEGDWPDCYRINLYIKEKKDAGGSAAEVLKNFSRWPTWMWANWEIVALAEWLRDFNRNYDRFPKIGFFGLDVYSLWDSREAIIDYLQKKEPEALEAAKEAYKCFEPYYDDERAYTRATQLVPVSCQQEVVELIAQIRKKMEEPPIHDESAFSARQNALVTVNAEKYYRVMVQSGAESWNIRDQHMAETLEDLLKFHGPDSKAMVWEHNTHIGDARATTMSNRGMANIGQLVREKYGEENVTLIGFGSYKGSVIAGNGWGEPMKIMQVPPAREGSWEYILHQISAENRLIIFDKNAEINRPIDHRAIGVVYHPQQERFGNYVPSFLSKRYDAFIYLDTTQELHPLHLRANSHKTPETYPFNF
ncbi:N/A [soil metagenome]